VVSFPSPELFLHSLVSGSLIYIYFFTRSRPQRPPPTGPNFLVQWSRAFFFSPLLEYTAPLLTSTGTFFHPSCRPGPSPPRAFLYSHLLVCPDPPLNPSYPELSFYEAVGDNPLQGLLLALDWLLPLFPVTRLVFPLHLSGIVPFFLASSAWTPTYISFPNTSIDQPLPFFFFEKKKSMTFPPS